MRLLLLTLLLFVAGCGAADTRGTPSALLTPTPVVSADPATTNVPPIMATPPASPAASPPALSSETLVAAIPDIETVAAALGVDFSSREVGEGLSQAFEGRDFSAIDSGVIGLYRGVNQDNFAIIDVARFRDAEAAKAFIDRARPRESHSSPAHQNIDLSGMGDEAFGSTFPDPDDEHLTVGVAYVRIGQVVSSIVARSTTLAIDTGIPAIARAVTDALA